MDVQTWAPVASIIAVMLAVLWRLSGKIDGVKTELKGDIGRLDSRMESGFARVDARLDTLERRTFDMATGAAPSSH